MKRDILFCVLPIVLGCLPAMADLAPAPAPAAPAAPSAPAAAAAAANDPSDVKGILDRATAAIVSPNTKPSDLDSVITDIQSGETYQRAQRNADTQEIYQQLESAMRFVKSWQTYLVSKTSGDQRAQNELQNLSNQEGSFMPIPRSKLLEMALQQRGGTSSSLGDLKLDSLDDIPGALRSMEALQRNGGYSMDMNNLQNALQNLNMAYSYYQDKNYPQALQMLTNNSPMMSQQGPVSNDAAPEPGPRQKVTALKNTLTMKILQNLLGLPSTPTLAKDQTVADYLSGLAGERAKASDWKGLQLILETYAQAASGMSQSWMQDDLAGIRAYLIGDKLESAGQHLDAIRSYRQSLATLGKYFPAAPAKDKLDDMAKKYPDDYKEALQLPISKTP
jgi:tetratricopeptide (TPR) repeat protein